MLVVLVVLGLILGLVITRGPVRSQRLETDAAARGVSGALRLARAQAIAQNRSVDVSVDVAAHSYQLDRSPPRALPASIGVSVTTVAGQTAGRRVATIRFAPDGSSSGGHIDLKDSGRTVQIGVDWLTGRVSTATLQ